MSIPFAYVLGLAVLLLSRELFFVMPGSGSVPGALAGLLAMAVPALLAHAAARRRAVAAADRLARWLSRASPALLPAAYVVLLVPCGYLDLVDALAGDSHAANVVLLLLPLTGGEVARLCAEAAVSPLRSAPYEGMLRARLAFVGLFTVPWIVLGVAGDLLQSQRGAYVFLAGTSAGLTLGTLAFVLGMGLLLPLLFRAMFGLTPRLPEPLGTELRATAAALGFPGRAVLWLDSGLRTVNALLLGPLPWPRYLVLTDGLVAALDLQALRGVVAHEVGHAQAGHPALLLGLFVVAPLLVANVAQQVQLDAASVWFAVPALLAVGAAWWTLRRVAHRFEHEADVLSAIALGGAEPCIRALQRVGQVIQQEPERGSLLHPSESARIDVLRRFAGDAQFRARFALRGLRLRRGIKAVLLLALLGAAWSWYESWPFEKAAQRFHVGDLAGARAQLQLVGTDVPGAQWQWWSDFRENLDAASAIAGDGGSWASVRPRLADEGWRRGVATLVRDGPAKARPWFALAVEDGYSALRRCVLLYCEADIHGDAARKDACARQIVALGCPPELRSVFAP